MALPASASKDTSAPPSGPPGDVSTSSEAPMTMLQSYLRARGLQPTAENMSRLLTENARGSIDIPGLVNDVPSTDTGVGKSGSVANKIEGGGGGGSRLPTPPIPPAGARNADTTVPTAPTTPANTQPAGGGMDLSNLGALILGGAAGGGLSAFMRGRTPNATPTPGGSVAPMPDPAASVAPAQTGNRFNVQPEQAADPLQAALAKAVPNPVESSLPQGLTSPSGVAGQVPRPPITERNIAIPPVPTAPAAAPVPTTPAVPGGAPAPNRIPQVDVRAPRAPMPRVKVGNIHIF